MIYCINAYMEFIHIPLILVEVFMIRYIRIIAFTIMSSVAFNAVSHDGHMKHIEKKGGDKVMKICKKKKRKG